MFCHQSIILTNRILMPLLYFFIYVHFSITFRVFNPNIHFHIVSLFIFGHCFGSFFIVIGVWPLNPTPNRIKCDITKAALGVIISLVFKYAVFHKLFIKYDWKTYTAESNSNIHNNKRNNHAGVSFTWLPGQEQVVQMFEDSLDITVGFFRDGWGYGVPWHHQCHDPVGVDIYAQLDRIALQRKREAITQHLHSPFYLKNRQCKIFGFYIEDGHWENFIVKLKRLQLRCASMLNYCMTWRTTF